MAFIAQEITEDRISLTSSDGTVFEYSSELAAKHGDPVSARDAIYAAIQQSFGEWIGERCIYIGIDDQFRFTNLELVRSSVEEPPPVRDISVTKDGHIKVVAFDGLAYTISSEDIKGGDTKTVIENKLAELVSFDVLCKYDVAVTTDIDGKVIDLKVFDISSEIKVDDGVIL